MTDLLAVDVLPDGLGVAMLMVDGHRYVSGSMTSVPLATLASPLFHAQALEDLGPRDLEDAAEGRDLLARDAAIGLGDLGAQRDHADGEGDG